jgi:cytochrome c oxidase subunit II
MAIPASLVTLILGMALVVVGLWVGQNVNLLPVDASSNAPVYDALFQVLFVIGTTLFVGIVGLVVFSLVRFRRRPGDLRDGLAVEGNLPLEIVWTAIPAVVVLFVGIYSYDIYERMGGMAPLNDHSLHQAAPITSAAVVHNASMHQHGSDHQSAPFSTASMGSGPSLPQQSSSQLAASTPSDPSSEPRVWAGIGPVSGEQNAFPVEVSAMQFAFLFHYPEADFISGELHVPVDRPVELRMQAKDVIHAFWVPQFRLKQDVIPGQTTVLTFTPTRAGSYPIVCAELCGPYHGGMRSTVVVHEPDDFEAWLARNRPAPPATVASSGQLPTA